MWCDMIVIYSDKELINIAEEIDHVGDYMIL